MKQAIGTGLKIFTYCGLAIAVLLIGDFLSLMDITAYQQTGHIGLFGFVSNYPWMIFAIMLIVPYFIVKNMRIWKKFE